MWETEYNQITIFLDCKHCLDQCCDCDCFIEAYPNDDYNFSIIDPKNIPLNKREIIDYKLKEAIENLNNNNLEKNKLILLELKKLIEN